MPPKRGIVKSGNAGNSTKASKSPAPASSANPEEKPLFPPGSKYPLSLLHERCQKNGWDKPVVDTRRHGDGFTFVVTLSRTDKKSSQKESVWIEPHPPYVMPTALEARHWGATYALYRFCNGMQLNRILPPGPREYWNQLAAERKNAPEHQQWMYDADPFAARKAVDERRAKASERRKVDASSDNTHSAKAIVTKDFGNAPEAKMVSTLRDLVEDSIKKAFDMYPETEGAEQIVLTSEDAPQLLQQLNTLGFKPAQTRTAIAALSKLDPLSSSLLRTLPPLQACIEYLILNVPECDLPPRFLPSVNTSNPFVTSTHAGTDNLQKRWIEERATKDCGWPTHVVRECISDKQSGHDWGTLITRLNGRLIGQDFNALTIDTDAELVDDTELESLSARSAEDSQLIIPLPIAPFQLVVVLLQDRKLPRYGRPPPMYIKSGSVPPYIRLHLVSKLLHAFLSDTLIDEGESFIMAAVRMIEEEWVLIEDNGPPDVSVVLEHMMFQSVASHSESVGLDVQEGTGIKKNRGRVAKCRRDSRTNGQVKEELLQLRSSKGYAEILVSRKKLPAYAAQEQFLKLLSANRCVVVVGETGCGKTTQLPQIVLDSLILTDSGSKVSVIVTQPRRLSALGVAARVSAERLDDGSVGYAIRGESKQTERTKLLFCTTGIVLRRLGSGDKLEDVTHVIVDEVHERSVDGDMLLLELKELMKTHPRLKIVLMSATINHEIFIKYFDNAPLITIPGFTHPVEDSYLEDLMPLLDYKPSGLARTRKGRDAELEARELHGELKQQGLSEDVLKAVQAVSRSDKIDYDLIGSLVNHIVSTAEKQGAILIFLPGVQEIHQCIDSLRGIKGAQVFPLHANLSNDEQRLVFERVSGWKIIAATNVAETSITIEDVVYVIDTGRVKEIKYDPESGLTKLVEQWVTRAAGRQRRGRAGRTQPGICYKLYTRAQERKMEPFPVPEIKRIPLESVALSVKVVHGDVKTFLSRAIDPPDMAAMDTAMSVLQELAALGVDGELTSLGRHMAMLPVDLRLGKMLILGTIFKCLEPVLTVAASISSKALFLNPADKREEANQARTRFATANSDLLTDVHAYDECLRLRSEGKSQSALRAFCEENFISASTIRDITSLRQDFLSSLSELGFVPRSSKPTDADLNVNSTNENLVKAVILGGLWPRVARVVLPQNAIKFDRVQAGTVQRENAAREYKLYDLKQGRVFLHPASILFGEAAWKSPFVTYFQMQATTKIFLRDATEVPIYGLLLFGGAVSVNHIGGGLTVGSKDAVIRLKAWPRIGVLVNQLRRLLDAQLKRCIEDGSTLAVTQNNPILRAMLALLENDGLSLYGQ